MDEPRPAKCQHVSGITWTCGDAHGSRRLPCLADATYQISGGAREFTCQDHLTDAIGDVECCVVRLVLVAETVDAALTAAGIPISLDRLQCQHATNAARVAMLASQRDQLQSALDWFDAEPGRLLTVFAERVGPVEVPTSRYYRGRGMVEASQEELRILRDMKRPTVGQVIAESMRDAESELDVAR